MILAMGLSFSLLAAGDAAASENQAPRVTAPSWAFEIVPRRTTPGSAVDGVGGQTPNEKGVIAGLARIWERPQGLQGLPPGSGQIPRLMADKAARRR